MSFGYALEPGYILAHLAALAAGLAWTAALTVIGLAGGTTLGLIGGALRAYRVPLLSPVIGGIVELVRTTPLFVQIFFLYFGLPDLGLRLPAFAVAGAALVVWGAAYNVENFRAALEAIPRPYLEAARALGLRPLPAFRAVALPIACRIAMPSVTNTSVETLKNSALMLAIGFPELTDTAVNLVAVSFRVFEVFITIGAAYLLLAAGLTRALRGLERRLAWPV